MEKPESKSASGLVMPDNEVQNDCIAKVIEVGQDAKFNAGDIVVIGGQFAGNDITIDNVDYKIVSSSEILAKYE